MTFKNAFKTTLALSAAVVLAACGSSTTSTSTSSANIKTEVSADTTITFWHGMSGAQADALQKLTDDFMAANPKIKVELQNQGKYNDLQAKINATLTSPKDLPTISQAYPGWLVAAAEEEMLVDLKPYISNDKVGYKSNEVIRQDLLDGAKINDVQYGIPFNKSTEVLVYNVDMLKEYGVEVPKTLEELKTAAKTIYEKSNGEVVGAGFDSLNNYYALGMKNKGVSFTKDLDITSAESKAVVNYYAEGIKAGYFRTAGSDKYLSTPFANKKVAMYIGTSAGESFAAKGAKEAGFEYGVAARPEKINIQQGTDIYMFTSASDDQRIAAYLYMKHLTSADAQLYWAEKTGYIPVVQSVLDKEEFKKSTATKVPAILAETTKELTSIPVVKNADSAYNELRAILENVFANTDNIDKILEESKINLQSRWNQ